jgi:hypothetical protein
MRMHLCTILPCKGTGIQCSPGENAPELAVAQNYLNAGGHYQCPLYCPHGLEEPLLNQR